MKCESCKKDVREVPLFRDEKEGAVIWKCKDCLPSPPPSDVKREEGE